MLRAAQIEPIALIDEADAEQQGSETQEAEDAVPLTQFADIHEKDFCDGDSQQQQRLPAQECRAAPEPGSQQNCAEHHEPCRVSELRIHLVFVMKSPVAVPAKIPPVGVNLKADG